jgi:hypothetical protein
MKQINAIAKQEFRMCTQANAGQITLKYVLRVMRHGCAVGCGGLKLLRLTWIPASFAG